MQERKLVTALFCDLVGSTALGEQLDPEALESVQAAYFDRMRSVVERYGGTLEKYIGDAVVAVFGVPQAHEDDAERAVRCALAMRDALAGLNDSLRPRVGVELEARIGVASGEALVSAAAAPLATGDVMNSAARLQQRAEPGEVLVSSDTARLTRGSIDYGAAREIEARGKRQPLAAAAAVGVAPTRRRVRAPLVGREVELETLAAAVEAAIRDEQVRVVVLLGEPGIGKSRLADEFAARVAGRAAVYRGQCLSYRGRTSWDALGQVVRGVAAIDGDDTAEEALSKLRRSLAGRHPAGEATAVEAQLGPTVGAVDTPVASGPELLWAVRRFLEALAAQTPAVVVLDDLHWASDGLRELVVELVETLAAGPLVLLFLGRPELREQLADVMASGRATTIEVGPLSHDEARELAGSLALDQEAARRAEGNPLFVEELAEMARDGVEAAVPPSLRALIAARLDLLPADAKRIAQAAAVVGDVFWDAAVAAALDEAVSGTALRVVRTRGLVEEDASSAFLATRQFRFHHALIREVAYESVAKHERAQLHRRIAAWLEERTADRAALRLPVAHHLDRAVSLLREVAPLEAPDRETVAAAARAQWLAQEWTDVNAAAGESLRLARRAAALAEGDSELHDVSRARLAHALIAAGRHEEATALAEDVLRGAPQDEASAYAWLALARAARDRADIPAIRMHADPALGYARDVGDATLEASALHVLWWADIAENRLSDAEARGLRSAEIARARGDLAGAGIGIATAGVHAMWRGALDVAEARAAEGVRLGAESGSLRLQAQTHGLLAHLRREQGRLEEAVEHGRERLRLELEVGDTFRAIGAYTLTLAQPLILLGRLDEAWDALEEAGRLAARIGAAYFDDGIRSQRAQILRLRGMLDEAENQLTGAPDLAASGDRSGSAEQLAHLRAAQGRHDEAERLFRALAGARHGENLLDAAHMRLQLAAFLAERGRPDEAAPLAASVRGAIEGRGAGLLETELADVEALFARA